jgi:ureidoglycolate lyase
MIQVSILRLPHDLALFAPYGTFVVPPIEVGQRANLSQHLGLPSLGELAFHTNRVQPSRLPLTVTKIERHPRAEQIFIPLNVARYVIAVLPSDDAGEPIPEKVQAFVVPGSIGVIYRAGVWHLGATVLDQTGGFAVLMRRRGDGGDDELRNKLARAPIHVGWRPFCTRRGDLFGARSRHFPASRRASHTPASRRRDDRGRSVANPAARSGTDQSQPGTLCETGTPMGDWPGWEYRPAARSFGAAFQP